MPKRNKNTKFSNHVITTLPQFCKTFRKNVAGLSLQKMSDITGISLASLSAFEHGKANAIEYLLAYYSIVPDSFKNAFKTIAFDCCNKDFYIETTQNSEGSLSTFSVIIPSEDNTEG